MALPKEPRQKMINLMYLVLTALLAMNVSAEILNAFKTVNNSLESTNKVVFASTDTYLKSLLAETSQAETKERADIWYPKALKVQTASNGAYNDIQRLKDSILRATGFNPAKNKDSSFKEDDIDAAQRILVEGGEGKKLYQTLQTFKTSILSDPEIAKELAVNFPVSLDTPKTKNQDKRWEAAYFHMTPTVAALTILSKFQNDIRTAENRAVAFCHNQVGHVQLINDAYVPLIGQNSNYLMPGQEIVITAGIGAFNSAARPQITVDGSPAQLMPDGSYQYKSTAGGTGAYSKHVHITYFNQAKNAMESKDVEVKYAVGSPTGASVSADDVKVLYVGLENHLTISGGNVGAEKVHPSIDNGALDASGGGKYIARPGKVGVANIILNIDGQQPQKFLFRVKNVPDPVAMVGASKGGRMSVLDFKAQSGVRAELENFIFEGVRFSIKSYTIVVTGGKKGFLYRQVVGNSFSSITDIIDGLSANTNVTLDEIRAVGPGGERDLPPITFNLF